MPIFERGTIVRVPFPYTNASTAQRRPALVVSNSQLASGHLLWVLMITSAENRRWPDDIDLVEDYVQYGLPAPSRIRPAKIATVERAACDPVGQVSQSILAAVDDVVRQQLGI